MGLRGELFSTKVILPNRTYFFNVKENRMGDLYLNIVESKNRETGGFDRQSVILFADDLQEFLKGFEESLRILEKEIRERRRPVKERSVKERPAKERSAKERPSKERPAKERSIKIRSAKERSAKEHSSKERPVKERKRVVVKYRGQGTGSREKG